MSSYCHQCVLTSKVYRELNMSIDHSGFKGKVYGHSVLISINEVHPLIKLANSLDWLAISELVLPDLKASTKKGCWWLGRPLKLRIHLGAYFLQQLFNKTDRQTEYDIKDNAAYQLFCGLDIVKKWRCPDHTKIEEFRSRLTADTQCNLANLIAEKAVGLGFADPTHVDVDSTIQEANMAYPSDTTLLCKLGYMAKRVADYMNEHIAVFKIKPMEVNIKRIKCFARRCFFLSKNAPFEEKAKRMKDLFSCVYDEIRLVVSNSRCMEINITEKMKWNMARIFLQVRDLSEKYLSDVKHFVDTGEMVKDKILSFHLTQAKCFTKGKPGKKYQFGRMFQIGRIKGNFLFAGKGDKADMPDKKSVKLMMDVHEKTFGKININSVSTDKGYYSKKNEALLYKRGVKEIGIQRPENIRRSRVSPLPEYREKELIDRRSGIEPLIGHAKAAGQLGRSRMKSDETIEASGFASILAFNLKQLIRYKMGKATLEPS